MVFSSIEFLYFFLPAALLIYYLVPARFKNLILLASGLIFYAWGEPIYVAVLLASALIDYTAGLLMSKTDDSKKRTACLAAAVSMNLALLFIFKYSSFAVGIVNSAFGLSLPDPGLPLPIGISFYTFQGMSYIIDLYRGKYPVQKSFVDFGAYVAMFPQIVAGPIVKYEHIKDQLSARKLNISGISDGVTVFVKGLAKKVLLANNIGIIWAQIKESDYSTLPALTAWIGIIAFAFQIYFDFSGYSDMAIGLGKMLGFEFFENFNLPYISKSVSEFWRRWHISLGSWFKEYVYFPLGGSRCGTLKTVRNLAVVWLLTGLWHGANINFVVWGLWFGTLIIIEHLGFGGILKKLPQFISWLYTMLAVIIGWVIFETDSLSSAAEYLKAMLGASGVFANQSAFSILLGSAVSFALCIFFASGAKDDYVKRLGGPDSKVIAAITPVITAGLLIASTAYLVNSGYNPFLYFNF